MIGYIWIERIMPGFDIVRFDYNTIKTGGLDTVLVNGGGWDHANTVNALKDYLARISESGINAVLNNWSSHNSQPEGVLDGFDIESWKNGKFDVESFQLAMSHPNIIAFSLKDEPALSDHDDCRNYYLYLKTLTDKPLWLNLLPNHANKSLIGDNYEEYIKTFYDCSDILGADMYPLSGNNDNIIINSQWYDYLKSWWRCRKYDGTPCWLWIHTSHIYKEYVDTSRPTEIIRPKPTLETIRLQAYANLMFGADDNSCYCYCDRIDLEEDDWREPTWSAPYRLSPLEYEKHETRVPNEPGRIIQTTNTYNIIKDFMPTYNKYRKFFTSHKIANVNKYEPGSTTIFSRIASTDQLIFTSELDDGSMAILNVSLTDSANVNIRTRIRRCIFKQESITIEPGDIRIINNKGGLI